MSKTPLYNLLKSLKEDPSPGIRLKNEEAPQRYVTRSQLSLSAAFVSLRKSQRITQVKLSQKTGVRQSTISEFESGKISITLDTFFKLLNALELECEIRSRSRSPIHSP